MAVQEFAFERKTLVGEIKSILQQYPDDGQIFKEIIQNAEDAEATKVVFIYDKNDRRNENEFSNEKLADFQGQCLYSYNDAVFEESDWKGIASLGISKKVKDPLKVGRFGLGFKSVFHLTDMPCISSKSRVIYLDPTKQIYDEVGSYNMTDAQNQNLLNSHSDFNGQKQLGEPFWNANGFTDGTLFKFPLRQVPSTVSSVCYDEENFQNLIVKFLKEAHLPLLFLKNIKEIQLFTIESGSANMIENYTIKMTNENQNQKSKFALDVAKRVDKKMYHEVQTLNHSLQLEATTFPSKEKKISRYEISEHFGYDGFNDEFIKMMKDEELSYVPLIAVAYPTSSNDAGGHIFSALPLPLQEECMTGMPVHVNGFFALGPDRKDLKWKTLSEGDQSNDKTVNWNNFLIQELLPLVYSNLLMYLITQPQFSTIDPDFVYKAWPIRKKVHAKWQMFLDDFYRRMLHFNCIYVVADRKWLKPNDVFFFDKEIMTSDQYETTFQFLAQVGVKSATIDSSLTSNLGDLNWVDERLVRETISSSLSSYHLLERRQQCLLLTYAVKQTSDVDDLCNHEIFPLLNGECFQLEKNKQKNDNTHRFYVPTFTHSAYVLPKLHQVVDVKFFETGGGYLLDVLKNWVRKAHHANLKVLDTCDDVLQAVANVMPSTWKIIGEDEVKFTEEAKEWIKNFSLYRRFHKVEIPLSKLEGIPLIPVRSTNGEVQLFKLSKTNPPMLESYNGMKISCAMKTFLLDIGASFVACDNVDAEDILHFYEERYVLEPNKINIVKCLSHFLKKRSFEELKNLLERMEKMITTELLGVIEACNKSMPELQIIVDLIKPFLLVTNKCDEKVKPCELYTPTKEMKDLFYGEPHKFPDESYDLYALGLFGLKSESSITKEDIESSVAMVMKLNRNSHSQESLLPKVTAMLIVIKKNSIQTSNLVKRQWIPVMQSKPLKYPKSLSWYVEEVAAGMLSPPLVSPTDVCEESNSDLVGSTEYIAHPSICNILQEIFPIKALSVQSMMKHLQNIQECYNDDEKGLYKSLIGKIYKELSRISAKEVVEIAREKGMAIWLMDRFIPYEHVILTSVDFDLTPHYYEVTDEVRKSLEPILEELGCKQEKRVICVNILKILKDKNGDSSSQEHGKDFQLAKELVNYLADDEAEWCREHGSEVFVPVEGPGLKLHVLKECFYHDFNNKKKSKYNVNTLSENPILHRDLGKDVAKKLSIPSLVSKVLRGNSSQLFKPWGQTEPLTLKLKRLLEDYQDGLSIIKELIQNADDAGAKEIKFLYDQRQNDDLKNYLIDPAMADWQGPALWVYNEKMFAESDFENITKINAGTKEFDTMKIGKFGLGFNSVYNITDVPSFLSGDSLVIFDPHAEYLGEALGDKDVPGIRIPLNENTKELNNFKDQFQVFDNIFGARLDFSSENSFTTYKSTLFRLPLRSSKTADDSEIKNMEYSDTEMRSLLQKLQNSLQHLLLFTENVCSVEVYELTNRSESPKDMKLLFSVEKKETGLRCVSNTENNIMRKANTELKLLMSNSSYHVQAQSVSKNVVVSGSTPEGSFKKKYIVQSCIGTQKTFEFAKQSKGCIPCGGVSIELNDELDPKPIPNRSSYLFCFLPLPIQIQLPVNVNGAFSIDRSRRNLLNHNIDEKRNGNSNWNDLLGEDISHAYYQLLLHIKDSCKNISLDHWISLLPIQEEKNESINVLKNGLIYKMLKSEDQIFPLGNNVWLEWNQLKFVVADGKIKNSAISFMNWYYNTFIPQFTCIDFPESFFKMLHDFRFEAEIKKNEIHEDQIFVCLLENVDHPNLDVEIRDEIMHYILTQQQSAGKLHELLKKKNCIPTIPYGKLKKPSELVELDSQVSEVYSQPDEVFPDIDKKHIYYLKSLGMHHTSIPFEMILERAQSVEKLNLNGAIDNAHQRSKKLLNLMVKNVEHCEPLEEKLQEKLIRTNFLKILCKPNHCDELPWFGFNKEFGSPIEMIVKKYGTVASCSSLICHDEIDIKVQRILQLNRHPSPDIVVKQCDYLVSLYKTKNRLSKEMWDVLVKIYDYVGKTLEDEDIEKFRRLQIIKTKGNQLAHPQQVYRQIEAEIPGYMYELDKSISDHKYERLMSLLGVQNKCTPNNYINKLSLIDENFRDKGLPDDVLKAIIRNVIPILCENKEDVENEMDNIYIPDKDGIMQLANNLCYKDADWLPDDLEVKYINEGIARTHAIDLKIKSLRCEMFGRAPNIIDSMWFDFGQKERLTSRIKNLLEGYSQKEDVFKELLQNADDAGTSEIEFILDKRVHGSEKIFSEKWKPLQGPALLVCNNGTFTKKDLEGIQKLGEGSKREDPLSTGKYGVGFNAVYSITDCPMLLTTVDGIGDVLSIFDPNLQFIEGATPERPGRMLKDARKFLQRYPDISDSLRIEEFNSVGKTLFRFPLRNQETVQTSKISDNSISISDIEDGFSKMKKKASDILLFLKNIDIITFTVIGENGQHHQDTFYGKSYNVTEEKIKEFKMFQKEFLVDCGMENISTSYSTNLMLSRKFCVQHFQDNIFLEASHWHLIEQCGFTNGEDVSDKFTERKKLYLIPKGGVAKLSKEKKCLHCEHNKKNLKSDHIICPLFNGSGLSCSLPLPVETGIAAVINGHFILDYETRRNLWSSEVETLERIWNNKTIVNCILPCYIQLLRIITEEIGGPFQDLKWKKRLEVDDYYACFPRHTRCKGTYWMLFAEYFYKSIYENDLPLLPVLRKNELLFCKARTEFVEYVKDDEINVRSSVSSSTESPKLLQLLKECNIHIDKIIFQVSEGFKNYECELTKCTPAEVRARLVATTSLIIPSGVPVPVKDTVFGDIRNLMTVLRYCTKDETKDNQVCLDKLPLCCLEDASVTVFSNEIERKPFFTKFTKFFEERKNLFLLESIYDHLNKKNVNKRCFSGFSLENFSQLLNQCKYSMKIKDQFNAVLFDNLEQLTEDWLHLFWKYMHSQKDGDHQINFQPVDKWSLLLVDNRQKKYLLPISKRKSVLALEIEVIPNGLYDALKMYPIFQPVYWQTRKTYQSELPRFYDKADLGIIFGSPNNPNHMIDALLLAKQYTMNTCNQKDSEAVLQHLSQYRGNVDEEHKKQLKKLPLFARFNGEVTSTWLEKVVVLPNDIPPNALKQLEELSECIFLKHNFYLEKLFEYLDFECLDWISFYKDYFLYHVDSIVDNDVEKHILYLKRKILSHIGKEVTHLLKRLSTLKLFVCRNGERKCCNAMYDPNHRLFSAMLGKENFPAEYYCTDDDWLKFLKKLGLICELTSDLFIQFSKKLETEQDLEKAEKVSKLMCKKLASSELKFDDLNFLKQIKYIKFIIPAIIREEFEGIHVSKNSQVKKICFNNSCVYSLETLLWTSKFILPYYATNGISQFTGSALSILTEENNSSMIIASGIQNTMNICNVDKNLRNLTKTCKRINETKLNGYKNALEKFYEFIERQNNGNELSNQFKDILKDISFVLVDDKRQVEVPRRSIFTEEMIISPYLNLVPVSLGSHFPLFKNLGCSKRAFTKHYIDILDVIYDISMATNNVIHPKELDVVKKTVCNLSQLLETTKEGMDKESTLYLPTFQFNNPRNVRLTVSSDILFVDDLHLEERLKTFDHPLLLQEYGTELDPNELTNRNLMKFLPEVMKPKSLRHNIVEVLSNPEAEAGMVGSDHISGEIKKRLQHPLFVDCIRRLFLHEDLSLGNVDQCLNNVRVKVLTDIKTHCEYNHQKIVGSELSKDLFLDLKRSSNELVIYFGQSVGIHGRGEMYANVAKGLIEVLGDVFKDSLTIMTFPLILQHEDVHSLSELLDRQGIKRDASAPTLKYGAPPLPGEPVPIELHQLLRTDFSSFEIGEYVAIDKTTENEEGVEYYVYGIFRRHDYNPDIGDRLYGIQTTENEDKIEDIPSHQVYKFERGYEKVNSTDGKLSLEQYNIDYFSDFHGKNYEEIIEELTKILKSLKGKSAKDRKTIIRRLYLTWHPDKHPEQTKVLATKVFQFLQNELKNIDKEDKFDFAYWNRRAYNSGQFFRHYSRWYNEYYRSRSSYSRSYYHYAPPRRENFNPQPTEAKRWWKQAYYDLKAIENIKDESYEWICYMAHQAAEKALKAALFIKDYQRLSSHDLVTLSISIPNNNRLNDEICEWSQQLQRIARRSEAMRYPDCWPAPKIPHTAYTAENAMRAKECAQKIVESTRDTIGIVI